MFLKAKNFDSIANNAIMVFLLNIRHKLNNSHLQFL